MSMSNPSSSNTPESSRSRPLQVIDGADEQASSPISVADVKINSSRPARNGARDDDSGHGHSKATRYGDGLFRRSADSNGTRRRRMSLEDETRRQSGGFLLAPMQRFRKRRRIQDEAVGSKEKGKDKASDLSNDLTEELETDATRNDRRSSKSSSINDVRPFAMNDKRSDRSQGSVRESQSSGPKYAEAEMPSSSTLNMSPMPASQSEAAVSEVGHAPVIDPSQIVRMALSLNESRRLNLSPGRLASNPTPAGGRVTSAGMALPPLSSHGHFADNGGSLRAALQQQEQQRRGSRNASPTLGTSGGPSPKAIAAPSDTALQDGAQAGAGFETDFNYSFSASTISRAEKARAYIELMFEYRRLLEVLPPLKPVYDRRSRAVGREYNPLQYIRNRKVRGRQHILLDSPRDGWNDPEDVQAWINSAERYAHEHDYNTHDVVELPPFDPFARKLHEPGFTRSPIDQLVSSPLGDKPKRPKLDWSANPADLLADAYWMELDGHKASIEDRNGKKLFPNLRPPTANEVRLVGTPPRRQTTSNVRLENWSSPDSISQRNTTSLVPDSDTSDSADLGGALAGQSESKRSRMKRRLLRKRKDKLPQESDSSEADEEGVSPDISIPGLRKKQINTGPLERHMNKVIEDESRMNSVEAFQPQLELADDGQGRRGGVSTNQPGQVSYDQGTFAEKSPLGLAASPRSSISTEPQTPRMSVEANDKSGFSPDEKPSKPESGQHRSFLRSNPIPSAMKLIHKRGKSKIDNKIDENDFAAVNGVEQRGDSVTDPKQETPRSSFDSAGEANPLTTATSPVDTRVDSSFQNGGGASPNASPNGPTNRAVRILKGDRISELVRSEGLGGGAAIFKQPPPRDDSIRSNRSNELLSPDSEDDKSRLYHQRSKSITDLRPAHAYRMQDLPTFRSTKAKDFSEDATTTDDRGTNESSRSPIYPRDGRQSRFDRFQARNAERSPDMSPNTSSRDLTRIDSGETDNLTRETTRDVSPFTPGMAAAERALEITGGVGKGGMPPTGLSNIDPKPRAESYFGDGARSIAGGSIFDHQGFTSVTARDISHVESLLSSSGIKAQAIVEWANHVPEELPPFLSNAALTANAGVSPTSRRHQHVVAARLISEHLETSESSFEKTAERFRYKSSRDLHARIDDLRDRMSASLTPLIQSCGDDADSFTSRLTTTCTLAVKQVNDGVDMSLRSRRRRIRWVRRAGFGTLEWLVVGLMWGIWLFVLFFRLIKIGFLAFYRLIRWLLWVR